MIDQPCSAVFADCISPSKRSQAGNSYIMVFHDYFSKWVECKALQAANAKNVSTVLDVLIISRWRKPEVIHTDNETEFVNKIMVEFTRFTEFTTELNPPTQIKKLFLNEDKSLF